MIIKNTGSEPVRIAMATRIVHLGPGVEKMLTEEEVRDPMLREALQVRTISIVRPATKDEVEALKARLAAGEEE
jgi:hypothetical protein